MYICKIREGVGGGVLFIFWPCCWVQVVSNGSVPMMWWAYRSCFSCSALAIRCKSCSFSLSSVSISSSAAVAAPRLFSRVLCFSIPWAGHYCQRISRNPFLVVINQCHGNVVRKSCFAVCLRFRKRL